VADHRWVIADVAIGLDGELPRGGLTARDMDRIPIATLAWQARREQNRPPGRLASAPKWADEELDFLQRYVELVKAGERRPAHVLADEFAITYRGAHNRLTRLRNEGLLSRPGPGAPGGEITTAGRAAIRKASNTRARRRLAK